jgi:hypothetical protein
MGVEVPSAAGAGASVRPLPRVGVTVVAEPDAQRVLVNGPGPGELLPQLSTTRSATATGCFVELEDSSAIST